MYNCVIDKIFESKSVRILKLEFVVVGEQAEEIERRQNICTIFAVVGVLLVGKEAYR